MEIDTPRFFECLDRLYLRSNVLSHWVHTWGLVVDDLLSSLAWLFEVNISTSWIFLVALSASSLLAAVSVDVGLVDEALAVIASLSTSDVLIADDLIIFGPFNMVALVVTYVM